MNTTRLTRRLATLALPSVLSIGASLGLALAAAPGALAQVTAVEPYHVVVSEDAVMLRCGAGPAWYPVAQLAKGDVLRVDGVEYGWLRVGYPPGAGALVKAADAKLDEAKGVVTLTKRTKLWASNLEGGVGASWSALLDSELAAGTALQSLGAVKDASGVAAGFRVVAPDGARGYVSERLVRKANESEVAAALGKQSRLAPTTTARAPSSSPEGPAASPATALGDAYNQPQNQPQQAQPQQTQAAAPAGAAPGAVAPEHVPAQPAAEPTQPRAADRRVAEFEALNKKYEEIKKTPVEQAELEPLIAEYQRYLASIPEGPNYASRRAVTQGTIDLLSARLEIKNNRVAAAAALQDAEKGWATVGDKKAALDAKPRYTVVGRLSGSTVYDGDRLPLMFRVLSVEGYPGRTLAYITPAPGVDVAGRVGQLVGVMGEGNTDASLGVPVLKPNRVDPLATASGEPKAP